jgi:hypothetical protein
LNLSLGCYKRKPGGNCWPEWSGTAINADYLAMVTEILSRSPEATLDLVMQCHSTDTRVVRGRYRIEFIAAIDGQNASARISPLEVETEEEERR